ncbi:hypothetical protein EDB89DRAFT_437045 [Lactarius sanguifluus]|nr:hypothetical protein EDB89DRAFT_437045 [Lactarius sanguifluus]
MAYEIRGGTTRGLSPTLTSICIRTCQFLAYCRALTATFRPAPKGADQVVVNFASQHRQGPGQVQPKTLRRPLTHCLLQPPGRSRVHARRLLHSPTSFPSRHLPKLPGAGPIAARHHRRSLSPLAYTKATPLSRCYVSTATVPTLELCHYHLRRHVNTSPPLTYLALAGDWQLAALTQISGALTCLEPCYKRRRRYSPSLALTDDDLAHHRRQRRQWCDGHTDSTRPSYSS